MEKKVIRIITTEEKQDTITISNLLIETAPLSLLNMESVEGRIKSFTTKNFTVKTPVLSITEFKLLFFIIRRALRESKESVTIPVRSITTKFPSLQNARDYEKAINSLLNFKFKFFFYEEPKATFAKEVQVIETPIIGKKYYLSVISSFEEESIDEVIPLKRRRNVQRWCNFTLTKEFLEICRNFENPIRGYSRIDLNYLYGLRTPAEVLTYLICTTSRKHFPAEFLANFLLGINTRFLAEEISKDNVERIRKAIQRAKEKIVEALEKLRRDGVVADYTVSPEPIRIGKKTTNWFNISIEREEI